MDILEALESVMCDVIKIRLKRRIAMRSKIKAQLKFGYPSFKICRSITVSIFSGWFPFPLLVAINLFRRIFMTSHMTLSSVSILTVFKVYVARLYVTYVSKIDLLW